MRSIRKAKHQICSGFTLIELLVVIAIIAILAALIFPVLSSARRSAKVDTCLSNLSQLSKAVDMYRSDNEGAYPQSRRSSSNPAIENRDGHLDDPFIYTFLDLVVPYAGVGSAKLSSALFACPEDKDPTGKRCDFVNPDAPTMTSFLANAYFVYGLKESSIEAPTSSIFLAERRSSSTSSCESFCDDIYHPWFDSTNPQAPNNDMSASCGGIDTKRHPAGSSFLFADGHVKSLSWMQTFSPPSVNLHRISN